MRGQRADGVTATGLARSMSLFYGASFLIIGVYGPYFPLWLKAQSLSPALVGAILSMPMFLRIVATPMATFAADRLGDARLMVQVMTVLTVLGFLAPAVIGGAPGFILLAAVNALALPSIVPLAETFALAGVHRFGLDYGRMRMWGTIMFIVANLVGGWSLALFGAGSILSLIIGASALTLAASLLLPGPSAATATGPARRLRFADVAALLAQPRYAALLMTAGAIQSSHGFLNAFASLTWQAHGIPDGTIGLLWATAVISEVILFAFARTPLARLGSTGLLVIGGSTALLRWCCLGFDPPLWLLFPLQALHGLSFGATHMGAMHDMARTVPQRLSATAQGLYAAATSGVALGCVVVASGVLFNQTGVRTYWFMAVIAAAGLALAIRFRRTYPHNSGVGGSSNAPS